MYESYPCSRCSYHDFLSCSGSRGFYLDPVEDYGTDHFHSRESVPRSFSRSFYVWCSGKLLRAYQEFLIAFIFSLLISCPSFAEDENYQFQYIGYEAMSNQGIDVNQYLMDQYQEERNAEIAQILAEPLSSPNLRSISSDSPEVSSEYVNLGNNMVYYTSSFLLPYSNLTAFYVTERTSGNYYRFVSDLEDVSSTMSGSFYLDPLYSNYLLYSEFYYLDNDNVSHHVSSPYVLASTILNDVPDPTYPERISYLSNVAEVFTWLLDHIAEIITFILGNAFLSISLLLFMCGAVISFYVRIRRS